MILYFVRHGKDDDNYRGGWSNMDLIDEGTNQVKRLAEYIYLNKDKFKINRIITSDLPRTVTTAKVIADRLGLKVEFEERLREINNGDLAGMLNEEALVKFPGLFFNTLAMDEHYPNGESPIEFYKRIKTWYENIIREYSHTNERILIVTHSGNINIIYHIIKKVKWTNKSKPFKVSNCAIHKLNVDKQEFEIENYKDFLYGK